MHLTINAPDQQLRNGLVQKVTIPTQAGEITVLPGHQSLISVVSSGIVQITPEELPAGDAGWIVNDGKIMIAVSKGLVAVSAEGIVITTSVATSSNKETTEVLEKMQADMLEKIAKIKMDGNESDLEEAIENMEKITADLRMAKIAHTR